MGNMSGVFIVTAYTSFPPSSRFVNPEMTSEGTPFSSSKVNVTVFCPRYQCLTNHDRLSTKANVLLIVVFLSFSHFNMRHVVYNSSTLTLNSRDA